MSKASAPARRTLLNYVLTLVLICIVIGLAAWTAKSSPAFGLNSLISPTHVNSFAFAEIPKATYTASPTSISSLSPQPTETPVESPIVSQTVEPLVYVEVMDTPTLEDVAPLELETNEITTAGIGVNKYILVDISEQHMYVYEDDLLIYSFVSSSGMNNSTRTGNFSVLEKIPNAYGETWNIWMPNWLGIYWSGNLQNGIHALPILSNGATLWEGYLGVPISYGCVVLGTYEAQLLYDWADIGTPVEIRW